MNIGLLILIVFPLTLAAVIRMADAILFPGAWGAKPAPREEPPAASVTPPPGSSMPKEEADAIRARLRARASL